MGEQRADQSSGAKLAVADDIRRILGALDSDKMIAIMALQPTVKDVEQAALWVAGDADVFGGQPLETGPGRIVEILTADEDDEALP